MFVIKRMTMIMETMMMTTMTMMTVNILRPVNLVGQPARCLYVAEARSSVLSVTPSALAASIYQHAGAFSHTKAYSWVQILRKDIKAYISIPEVFFRAFPHF